MDKVTETTYELFNRKLFSLPKVLLLPGVIAKTPEMIATIFPFIFLSDWVKGRAITYMTTRVESLQKEIKELTAVRSTIEAFDIKNAELLQRSGKGATQFTQKRWETLSVKIQAKSVVSDLITRTKGKENIAFGLFHAFCLVSYLIWCCLCTKDSLPLFRGILCLQCWSTVHWPTSLELERLSLPRFLCSLALLRTQWIWY